MNVSQKLIFQSSRSKCYAIVAPGAVSPVRLMPLSFKPKAPVELSAASIKNQDEIFKMRQVCSSASTVLRYASSLIKVGRTTDEIDRLVHEYCIAEKLYPSPFLYKGFPKSICTSVNNIVCHGIPDDRPLQNGDIINLDVTVYKEGFHGDCSMTYLVGDVDESGKKLVSAVKSCLEVGIGVCHDGAPVSAIGKAIQEEADSLGFQIIPAVAGHGIGHYFHEPPDIFHFDGGPDNTVMRTGMTFTIEPALSEGGEEIEILQDGWTAVTADNSRSAQAEHTILITESGAEILTI